MRKKQVILLGLAAMTVCAYALLSRAGSSGEVMCGLGPPPGSSGFAAFEAREASEVQRVGYTSVCAGELARYQISSRLSPMAAVSRELEFQPVALANTPFNAFTALGALAEAVSNVKSRLYRSFKMPDGHTVTLFEDDMSADGTQSFRNPKDEPDRVNDLPARLVVMQVPNGEAVSIISWTEGRRSYELWLDANVVLAKRRAQFIALAATLPKSIPARAQEPDLKPMMVGADGLPVMPASPATIP